MRLVVFALLLALTPFQAMAERVALVIGMSDYVNVAKLKNTIADADKIAAKLQEVGFKVTLATDKSQNELLDILQTFSFQAETADLALVYYAGHGVEVRGVNYMVPVDAAVGKADDITRVGVSLNQILKSVERARKMRVVILDSCRNNPFAGMAGFDVGEDTSLSGNTSDPTAPAQGLAPVNPELGTLVAYAAKAGQVALDGLGDNSPYATALVDAFGKPDVEIGLMFRQVRDEVLKNTGNLQEPYQYGSLSGTPFYLAGTTTGSIDIAAEADPKVAWANIKPDQELQMRAMAEGGDTRALLGLAYMRLNPDQASYNPAEAVEFLTKAADAGAADSQYELAKLYEKGLGVPADPVKALALYRAAADQGLADAVNDLGFLYYQGGLGIDPDQATALEYFRQAADLRQPEAMFNYAGLMDEGQVPGAGPEDAAKYLYSALRSGSEQVLTQLTTRPDMFKQPARKALQKILKENSFYTGPIDGDFGKSTTTAIKKAFGLAG
ncbi:MAG: caspase family protein [Candidatus Saccharibacteria bacterium]|nr:caspase family protein [Pseudorhodobacter sp.]